MRIKFSFIRHGGAMEKDNMLQETISLLVGEVKQLHAYCLFCETQRCKFIAEYISQNLHYTCFSPCIAQRKWIKGVSKEVVHQWLPGYIFLYSDNKINIHFSLKGIIRCLGNGELTGQDLVFAEMIYRKQGIIGSVRLIKEGNRCTICDPAWDDLSGQVIKVDNERRRCCIEFVFDGITRTVWVGYEYADTESVQDI